MPSTTRTTRSTPSEPSAPVNIALQGAVEVGDFRRHYDFAATGGAPVAVLGPNGIGKSTLLRAIAGLQPLATGRLSIGGQVVDEPSSGTFVPAGERRVGYLPAEGGLFPHLAVIDNVAFGLRARGLPRRQAHARAREWLERLGVSELAENRPTMLSTGQRQRVAFARTLATQPDIYLLDEPLNGVDEAARTALQTEAGRVSRNSAIPFVVVTHDRQVATRLATVSVELS